MNTRTNDLGRDPVHPLLLRLALPSILAQLVNMLYNIVYRIYIGHIPGVGAAALTGVGVTMPVILLITAFSSLIGMGGAPRAAIKMGQQDNDGAERVLGTCFTTLLGISVVLTVFFLAFGRPLLMAFGASESTIDYAVAYMNIYVCGTIFVQMALGLNTFISTQGLTRISMMTVVIGAIINIVLDPVFIFLFGMGVEGAALATILSQAVSAVWVLKFLSSPKSSLRLRKKYLRPDPKIMGAVLALGVSPFIMQSTESLLNLVFNTSLQWYGGDLAVGSMTILASMMQFMMLPLMGLTQGTQPIISYNYGAQNNGRVRQAFSLLLRYAIGYTVFFWVLILAVPQLFVSMFTSDPQLVEYASWAMRIYLGASCIMGAQIACQQTFIAVGQAKSSLFLALLRKVILLIPLILILPFFFENKVMAVFLAEPVADLMATTVTVIMFTIQFRKILAKNEPHSKEEPV